MGERERSRKNRKLATAKRDRNFDGINYSVRAVVVSIIDLRISSDYISDKCAV